jgi:tryptophan 2,3-dioxygenase
MNAGTTVLPIPMWATVFILILGALGTLFTVLNPILLAMINRKQGQALANSNQALLNTAATKTAAEQAAVKVEAVRSDLKEATGLQSQELKAIHTSVNSDREKMMKKQDELNAHVLDLTSKIATLVAEKAAADVAQNRRSTDPKPEPTLPN